jgi:hypothetical protein
MKKILGCTRRDFLKRSVLGIGGLGFANSYCKNAGNRKTPALKYEFDNLFPRYTRFDTLIPTWCVTPKLDRCIHRFHLSSPFSPSGRYLGLTRLSREDLSPEPGEPAEIVLVNLVTGDQKIVAETSGWDTQLGAQVQWGASDNELFFNDIDTNTWLPFGVKMNPFTGTKKKLDGTVYSVSPDGKWAVSTCLRRIGAT